MVNVDAFELETAMMLVDNQHVTAEAWVCRDTGKVYLRSDEIGQETEALPDDIDTSDRYLAVPGSRDLDLGHALAFAFTEAYMGKDDDRVRTMFRRKGAYGQFANLVAERGLREQWHRFRDEQIRAALRAWCEENGMQLA